MERSERAAYAIAAFGFGGLLISMAGPEFIPDGLRLYFGYGGLVVMVLAGGYIAALHRLHRVFGFIHRRTKLNLFAVLATLSAISAIVFAGLYLWDRSRGPVIWTWNQNSPVSFWMQRNGPLLVSGFQIQGENRSEESITGVSAYIKSGITGQKYKMKILINGTPSALSVIRAGKKFYLYLPPTDINPEWKGNFTAEQLRNEFTPFTFIFECEGIDPKYTVFDQSQIDTYITSATVTDRKALDDAVNRSGN